MNNKLSKFNWDFAAVLTIFMAFITIGFICYMIYSATRFNQVADKMERFVNSIDNIYIEND
jgi:hypothetical protein